jgi:hypothetical protein
MNLRKQQIADLIVDNLTTLSIGESDIIVIRLPNGVPVNTSRVGQSIVDALRAINKQNPVLLLPYNVRIQDLNESDMKEMGWVKDAEFKESDVKNSEELGYINTAVDILIEEQRRIWERELTTLLRKLQDTKPQGINASGYITGIIS